MIKLHGHSEFTKDKDLQVIRLDKRFRTVDPLIPVLLGLADIFVALVRILSLGELDSDLAFWLMSDILDWD